MKTFDYSKLTLDELINKISISRFFNIPEMVSEALRKIKILNSKPYKIYTALLSQTGTNTPTAIILENTLGNIVWSRQSSGVYKATLLESFTSKTYLNSITLKPINGFPIFVNIKRLNLNEIEVNVFEDGVNTDNLLSDVSIEIRVYN